MPPLEVTDLQQWAVLWAWSGKQDRHGIQTVESPIEIRVRWVANNRQILDSQGNTIATSGEIVAARDIPPMSILWLGKIKDLPNPPNTLVQCYVSNTTPDIKGRNTRFTYDIVRYSNKLPPLVS